MKWIIEIQSYYSGQYHLQITPIVKKNPNLHREEERLPTNPLFGKANEKVHHCVCKLSVIKTIPRFISITEWDILHHRQPPLFHILSFQYVKFS